MHVIEQGALTLTIQAPHFPEPPHCHTCWAQLDVINYLYQSSNGGLRAKEKQTCPDSDGVVNILSKYMFTLQKNISRPFLCNKYLYLIRRPFR